MNIAEDLLRHESDSERVLLVGERLQQHSYAEVAAAARGLAHTLIRRGVRPGDRVLVALPNGAEYIAAYYGALIAGATAVTIPGNSPLTFCRVVGATSGARIALAHGGERIAALRADGVDVMEVDLSALAREAAFDGGCRGGGSDCAQIIFTSGTTGEPKGVMLSHAGLAENTRGIVEYLGLTDRDRVGVVLDFTYSYGNSLLLTHVRAGGSLALLGTMAFPRQVTTRLARAECTGFSGVPSTFAILLQQHGFDATPAVPLRYVTCAGGALPAVDIVRLRVVLPRTRIFLMYGQTEASARLSYLPPEELDRRSDSIGRGMPGVRLTVLRPDGSETDADEEGEIVAAGRNLMMGYWNDPAGTADVLREGRLWTGDLAVRDADGFIRITGRRSELIKTAGFRVHPREIEERIRLMDRVEDCAVVGVPDPVMGEVLVACVVGETVPSVAEVRNHLGEDFPEFKWPRHVQGVPLIPRTQSGKVRRRELSATAAEALGIA